MCCNGLSKLTTITGDSDMSEGSIGIERRVSRGGLGGEVNIRISKREQSSGLMYTRGKMITMICG